MKYLIGKRFLSFVVCLSLTVLLIPAAAAENAETPLLRVLLRRLEIGSRLILRTNGPYLLESPNVSVINISGDTSLSIELRDQELVLFLPDASVALGKSAKLTRANSSQSSPSLQIQNSSGSYPGDLSLSVADDQIRAVLNITLEDYVLGVVPNEMSDSFPLEALKAQAVCARTYALRKIGGSGSWDVVDTTNDQVFRGISASNKNSARAVSETSGLVLMKGSRLVECYYSASNGGQTELPANVWGGSDYTDCYAMLDDPWDIANPDSVTRSAELSRDGTGLYRRISALLQTAVFASSAWKSSGFTDSDNTFRIDGIASVCVRSPRYPSPSRMMTEMEFTLNVSGRKVSGGTLGAFESAGSITVTLPVTDVLDALGLRISSSANELVSVEEDDSCFRIVSRRFGHGVGLSQRGAQWMASNGNKTYEQILAFYYPGSRLSPYKENPPALSDVPPLLQHAQEQPAPSATPRPTLMPVSGSELPPNAWLASVERINDDSSLNLRSQPSPIASVIMRLYKHQQLVVLDESEVPGWAHVKTDDTEGYVMSSYLEPVKEKEN